MGMGRSTSARDVDAFRHALPHLTWSLEALEQAADADPTSLLLTQAIDAILGQLTAHATPIPIFPRVVREQLVRWDLVSTTWLARRDGHALMIRVLRPAFRQDPSRRRTLMRDGQALKPLYPMLTLEEEEGALLLPLGPTPGPLGPTTDDRAAARTRWLAEAARWCDAGLAWPALDATELRPGATPMVACLHPERTSDREANVTGLLASPETASELDAAWNAEVSRTVVIDETLTRRWCGALAGHLTRRRHALADRWHVLRTSTRASRLIEMVDRLRVALPAPEGSAVVGVDMQGDPIILESDGHFVRWRGLPPKVLVADGEVVAPRDVRQIVRMRAAAPPNARMNDEHGGDLDLVDPLCRWLSTALALRTIDLLLDHSSAGSA